ncbi:MAG: 30S ribosomal protein S6--L-glutamate ligase [Myxococcota bacterium]
MKIAILSRKPSLYSTQRLVEAVRERGHEALVVDYLRCYMDLTSRRPAVLYRGMPLKVDAVLPRIGASYTFYGSAVVRQFEMMSTFTANAAEAITRSRDKLRAIQLLAQRGLPIPVTSFAHSTKDIEGLIGVVGGAPLIVKLLEGTQGSGVVLAETRKAAESVIGAFHQLDANILVQQFVKEARGEDLRAFVVGDRIVAAMRRTAREGEFRANIHQGGTAEAVTLTPSEETLALEAAATVGLNVAGVDMLQGREGPLVLEVNSSPGLEGIEAATGLDVAGEIVDWVIARAARGGAS